jgi:hypothetical protein
MKILFTGMSSYHCKPPKTTRYFGTLAKAVARVAEVSWAIPSVKWSLEDLAEYDYVVVGVSPPTSLSANKAYGGLHVMNLLWDDPRLKLVVDSPQIWQYKNSINRSSKNLISGLFPAFYANRWEYSEALTSTSIPDVIDKLNNNAWPVTIFPGLPWKSDESIVKSFGLDVGSSIISLNLDAINLTDPVESDVRQPFWSIDDANLGWSQSLAKTIKYETVDVRSKRGYPDQEATETILDSVGLIIPPQERKVGTWWTYRYVQGMNTLTPIATDWLETVNFSPSWSKLAYQIEDMSSEDRRSLAQTQREDYVRAIPSVEQLDQLITSRIFN